MCNADEVKHKWTDDMDEISGFGGGYEAGCRAMVSAGLAWLEANPQADPRMGGFKGVTGIHFNNNADAEALEQAMLDAPCPVETDKGITVGEYGATGAMVQFSMRHALSAHKIGWDAYCAEMRKRKLEK